VTRIVTANENETETETGKEIEGSALGTVTVSMKNARRITKGTIDGVAHRLEVEIERRIGIVSYNRRHHHRPLGPALLN